ncbi:DMT family transporter [Stomatohabitans albus]|uniref:DMT family transporter n=1 Tax=Stomatohabitans albus TaxID=3110766 RepID=UPI00300D3DC8
MSLFIAILLACAAAIGFAVGAALQHDAVDLFHRNGRVSTTVQLRLSFRNRRWLSGLALLLFSAATHIGALALAPVTVIQPIGVLAVPLSVIISQKMRKTTVTRPVWIACALTITAVTAFTYFSTKIAHSQDARPNELLWSGLSVLAVSLLIGLVARTRRFSRRTQVMMWSVSAALLYGYSSGLIKATFIQIADTPSLNPTYVAILVAGFTFTYAAGFYCVQRGYATGAPEIVISVLTTADPLAASIFGLVLLKEGVGVTPSLYATMAFFAVLAVVGVALLSSNHPDTIQHRSKQEPNDRNSEGSERTSHENHDGSRHVRT